MRALRLAIDDCDDRLRLAVATRDEHLARVGQAALGAQGTTGRITAFAATVRDLEADHADADDRRAERVAAVEAHDTETTALLATFEIRLEALPAEESDEADAARATVEAERAEARSEADVTRAKLAAGLVEADATVQRAAARRRATLVDLGREVVRADPTDATRAAHQALTDIEALRSERSDRLAERDAIDSAPITRTLAALGGALVLGLLLTRLG